MSLSPSELILNDDQSIYHLNLHPEDIGSHIITVGDPDRVAMVSAFFDSIEVKKQKREFTTHTGSYKGVRITVISTGIGTDNIDIVLNELDALVNIDFKTRQLKSSLKSLHIIRIGTSGAIQENIDVDSILISKKAVGLDALLHFYEASNITDANYTKAFMSHMEWDSAKPEPYMVAASSRLLQMFKDNSEVSEGISVTNVGFYGPQSRSLRLAPNLNNFHERLRSFSYEGEKITNLEMETSGIYGLSKLLGHEALSVNCILANRATGEFSSHGTMVLKKAIQMVLDGFADL